MLTGTTRPPSVVTDAGVPASDRQTITESESDGEGEDVPCSSSQKRHVAGRSKPVGETMSVLSWPAQSVLSNRPNTFEKEAKHKSKTSKNNRKEAESKDAAPPRIKPSAKSLRFLAVRELLSPCVCRPASWSLGRGSSPFGGANCGPQTPLLFVWVSCLPVIK